MIKPSSIVVLTGAGISAESGVDTFRDKDGIWSKVDFREVAGRAARNRRWRYVEWGENGSQGIELYDQQNDPTEMNNLAAETGHEAIVQEMKALLDHQHPSE